MTGEIYEGRFGQGFVDWVRGSSPILLFLQLWVSFEDTLKPSSSSVGLFDSPSSCRFGISRGANSILFLVLSRLAIFGTKVTRLRFRHPTCWLAKITSLE